jgi:hypothetical protein
MMVDRRRATSRSPEQMAFGAPLPTWIGLSRVQSPATRRAADQVRASDQPQDRQGASPDNPAVGAAAADQLIE